MGIIQMLVGGWRVVSNFVQWDIFASNTAGNLATASFTLNPDGSVTGLATPTDAGGTPGSSAWHSPVVGGVGANYWCRFTPTVGTATTNDAVGWTQLNAARSITKGATAGAAGCTFTIEIATDAAGANIVLTRAGNQVRYTHI